MLGTERPLPELTPVSATSFQGPGQQGRSDGQGERRLGSKAEAGIYNFKALRGGEDSQRKANNQPLAFSQPQTATKRN